MESYQIFFVNYQRVVLGCNKVDYGKIRASQVHCRNGLYLWSYLEKLLHTKLGLEISHQSVNEVTAEKQKVFLDQHLSL